MNQTSLGQQCTRWLQLLNQVRVDYLLLLLLLLLLLIHYTIALHCKELSQSQAYLDIAGVLRNNLSDVYIVTGSTAALSYVLRDRRCPFFVSPVCFLLIYNNK